MAKVTTRIIKNNLPKLVPQMKPKIAQALDDGAARYIERVKSTVRVSSGETKESARVSKKAAQDLRAEASVGGAIIFEEFGTARRPAHPTCLPAFEATLAETIADLKEVIE